MIMIFAMHRLADGKLPLLMRCALLGSVLLGATLSTAQGNAQVLPSPTDSQTYPSLDAAEVAVGRLLFWDPIISGNRNISCGTCHHPKFGTSDGVPLALGEGGIGLGPKRHPNVENMPESRIPRNAPALFNLGATEFTVLFHDGRIEADASLPSGFRTPLGDDMLVGFASVLSAQTMFPVLSGDEMAGHYSENDVSKAVRQGRITGADGAWHIITNRVADIPEYTQMFDTVIPGLGPDRPLAFTDISNAIAAFVSFEWRSDQSPFDRHINGDDNLAGDALDGMDLFYGPAGCSVCHAGVFQTDHDFHAMGVPQIGPGKAASFETHSRDLGRMRVTGQAEHAYAFRTPSLRNVMATAPYGHDGAYGSLVEFLAAHQSPKTTFQTFDRSMIEFPELLGARDWDALDDPSEQFAISDAAVAISLSLDGDQLGAIMAFLQALSDDVALSGRLGIPAGVPSGLAVDR